MSFRKAAVRASASGLRSLLRILPCGTRLWRHLLDRRWAGRLCALGEMRIPSGLGDSAWLLYALVRAMKPDVCVEIGTARGKSTCFTGMALRDNGAGRLYAIDPHTATDWNDAHSVDTLGIVTANIRRLSIEGHVTILRSGSDEVGRTWATPIDILFIDGDHSYEGVKRDWELFLPFVQAHGVVVFHDTMWERMRDNPLYRADMGVPRFVEELRVLGYPVVTLSRDCGVSVVQPCRGGYPLYATNAGDAGAHTMVEETVAAA